MKSLILRGYLKGDKFAHTRLANTELSAKVVFSRCADCLKVLELAILRGLSMIHIDRPACFIIWPKHDVLTVKVNVIVLEFGIQISEIIYWLDYLTGPMKGRTKLRLFQVEIKFSLIVPGLGLDEQGDGVEGGVILGQRSFFPKRNDLGNFGQGGLHVLVLR